MAGKLLVGTSGWNYYDWEGLFYPDTMKARDYLAHYAHEFRTTEVNYSFYHLPKPATYENWAAQVPQDFRFAVKASRVITHIRRLRDVADLWQTFLENASMLGNKLGPILLQFPPSFKRNDDLLDGFLTHSSKMKAFRGIHLAMEFRHASWFTTDIIAAIEDLGFVVAVIDAPARAKLPMIYTGCETMYIRLHGHDPTKWYRYNYTDAELESMHDAISDHARQSGTRQVFVFFDNDFEANAPRNAMTLASLFQS